MSFEFDLSDRLISGELRRAEELSVGLPRAAGINAPTKIVKQTIRFPDYHEPLDRSVPILALIFGQNKAVIEASPSTKKIYL